jgi:hypothetical protein
MNRYPVSGCPEEVLPNLRAFVDEVVGGSLVTRFFIGRTLDLSAARQRHACDYLFALYVTDKAHHAVLVEDRLAGAYHSNERFDDNIVLEEEPSGSRGAHFVYLAVWTPGAESRAPGEGAVDRPEP